ncbi:sulfatase-like protein [Phytophthora infestans T30-4]|uniref:Sulfatase-like protein n=1 Tax=Phytophthora infestans (strain T30-4) TaxID=403677 RepID=D0NA33_PHYIT|nr:sulfatase-like protein [Phytophthora infestans T30-4]EEY54287.1 sulfatase-like protein [Phytophthora infestans T30-4]|eukprot:XP_002904109.1 sulfatase-like protein [Phytophthora infestans T30-4]
MLPAPSCAGWAFVYCTTLLFFSAYRVLTLRSLITMYGTEKDATLDVQVGAVALGALQDLVCATYLSAALWGRRARQKATVVRFFASFLLFAFMSVPFVADQLLVRIRDMRFNFDLVKMAIHESNNASAAEISSAEVNQAYISAAMAVATATVFACVRASNNWADLTSWSPTKEIIRSARWCGRRVRAVVAVMALVLLPAVVLALSQACSALVAYAALNATLNELFMHALFVSSQGFLPLIANGSISAETYIHTDTEDYELFREDSLYRRTTGFHGDLAFDVKVENENPPNVLLVVVESFRYHDSHYLVGQEDPSNLFRGSNVTVTPNFDKWAKRGVAFGNMWSSWRTSRSVESLLFAQVPYDSVADSGMTGGKKNYQLDGLPQLFKAKGYEPFFTTGCKTDYDDWDTFLPSHGFDTVWGRDEMINLAESDLGITPDQWFGKEHRELYWGVHDDISYQILGDLMVNKTKEQGQRMAKGEAKKPLFLTHYTISSHVSYEERPTWYAEAEKPDFSSLYDGVEYAASIKNYVEMRYFSDMEFGKFMDRMSAAGILNDTIVVVVGDHGQAPEAGNYIPEARDVSVHHVAGALVAEGRLGDAVGLKIEDASEQYDILNTLADIVGVPEEGFLQDGVGRSLKRQATFGERVVYSNNPSRKMSIVRGTERLRYDRAARSVLLHDAKADHDMHVDLFPDLTLEQQNEWLTWRDHGRQLTEYYVKRWDKRCLFAAKC